MPELKTKTKAKSKPKVIGRYIYPLPAGWNVAMRAKLVSGLDGVVDADIIDNERHILNGKIDSVLADVLIIVGVDLPFGPKDILAAAAL